MKSLRQPINSLETTMLMMVAVAVLFWLVSPHLSLPSLPQGATLPRFERPQEVPAGGYASEEDSFAQVPSGLPPEVVKGLEDQQKSNRQMLAEVRVIRCDMFADFLSSSSYAGTPARHERTVVAVKRLQRQNNC